MANGTRSSSRKAKDDENNDLKGSQNNGKKSVNLSAATAEASGVRRSPRETLSKKNMTPPSSSGTRKSERLEKQTSILNSTTPPAKRKTEQFEKKKGKKNDSPLRRSERGKMSSSSASSGSKRAHKTLDVLNTKRKKEKKRKCVKQLTMQTVEVNKIEQEDEQAEETQKKRITARSYRALFRKQPKKVDGTDRCSYLSGTDSGRREEDILEEFTERTCERTTVTSTSQFAEEKLKRNDEHTLLPTSQKNNCKNMSFDGGDPKMYVSVAGETNNDAETTKLKNLQNSQLVNSIMPGGVLDCDISVEMVPKVEPSERKGYDIDIDSAASPKMSSNDIGTCTGPGTSLSSGCKRKDCTETCGMCSKRQRVDCNSTKPGICSSNMKLNQFFGSSDVMDRGKLDAGISTGHIEKPGNHIQQHTPSADLQSGCVQNTCIICRLDGKLLCCHGKGCQRSYHLSCLEPPLEEFHLGAWYCQDCVRKKLESGIYSVSEGIEAIWDSRELEDSEDGLQGQKQYFVKYKGLAHVHNRWVPEKQVLLEAPSLIAKYNGKNQGTVWKQQWAVPRRLLQKRLWTTPKECDEHHNEEHDVDKLKCHVEWLVKWCGLGYEHASWELDNASFFSCPEGRRLIREYETRKKAQRASKFDKERVVASLNFSHLPATVSSGLDANLDAVNKLCNHWCRDQNAIIFDDQERISNVISSILAFSSEISRPFLIISSPASQYSWDEEFLHLAPSVDVVVYNGSKEIRNSISNLEFYDEGSCIMFQILITSPEVISEDLNVLDCIGWEAIVVDECQRPRIGSCFEQIKMLTASKRLLIISSQLKDNVAEYLNLLSLLDSQSDSNDTKLMNSSDNIDTLKERLSKFVAYECKLESSRFLEYWVPVLLSNVQLEKYCFTLVSNSLSLCSPSKTDPVGVLRSILVSSRKCCDHPYDVDQSLQMLLTKGLKEVEFLEVGIKASGKLQVLDAMLWEIKKRELKVLILFQLTGGRKKMALLLVEHVNINRSFVLVCLAIGAAFLLQEAEVANQYIGGSGRDLMGDILDDFLRQRFGIDSYERVSNGVTPSKKQSALNRFNNESERFVFLLETRACLPSIKLSAVGTVIIFGSDWSPSNDLRALQRINIDSQFEHIKVFRLYSPFTVEEKLLMLSKHDKAIDSNVENISPSISHMLLKWGASYLFSQLENFHDISTLDASTLSQKSHLKDVIQEFYTILLQTGIDDTSKLSLILQAKQKQGTHRTEMYRTEMPLFGEQKIQVMNEDSSHTFWTKLLEGKCPRWKYSTNTSQRNRKRIQYFDELQNRPQAESAEVTKRRKKFVSDGNDHPSQKTVLQEGKLAAGDREGRSGTSASGCDKIHATSSSLHEANNISKTPALKMVEWESRRKQRDSQKILHVLLRPQIAKLCEILHLTEDVKAMVERFLEYVMNNHLVHREPATILQAFQISLCWSAASLLKQKLDHKESLALAKQHLGFACKKEEADYVYSLLRCLKRMFLYRTGYLKVSNSPKASGLSSKAVERDFSNATSYQQNIKATVEDLSGFREGSDKQTISESGVAPEIQLAQRDLIKSIKEIQKKCDKLMKKQIEIHKREMEQFNQKYEEEKAQLENKKRTEAAVIRLHSNVSMRTNKLKSLDTEYARKFNELERQMDIHLKDLEALQVAARINVQERKTRWVESVKSWARDELVKSPVSETNLSEGRSSGIFQSAPGSEVRPPEIVHIVDDEVMVYSDPINKAITFKEKTGEASIECNLTANSGGVEQAVSRDSCLRELDSVDGIPNEGVLVDVPVTTSSADVIENVFSMRCSDEYQISDGSKAYTSDCETNKDLPLKAAGIVGFQSAQRNISFLLAPSSENFLDINTLRKVDGETPLRELGTNISSEGLENFVSLEASSSVEIPDESNLCKADVQVPLRETVVADSGEGQENLVSAEALSSVEIPNGAALNKFDGEVHLGAPVTVSSSEGYESLPSLLVPSTEEVPGGTTLNTVDRELPLSRPEAFCTSEHQGNIMSAEVSFEKQIPGEATLNVSDEEIPKSISEIATSCDGMSIIVCTKSSASTEQIPDTAACYMPAKEVSLVETETVPSEVLKGGSVRRENDGTSPIENDQQDGAACTMNRESSACTEQIPDTAACYMPAKEVYLVETETVPSEVFKGGSARRENDGTSPIENDQQDGIACTMKRESSASTEQTPDTAACYILAKEVSFAETETVPSEVLKGGSVQRENDGTRPIENDQQDSVLCTMDRESSVSTEQIPDTAACYMPAKEVSLAETETVPSEVLKGGGIQRENDGTSPIENDQQDGILCTMNRESSASTVQIPDTTACYMPAKEVSLAETETVPGEVLKGGSVQRENDGTSPVENDWQDGALCTMNRESVLQEPSSVLVSTDAFQARCLANSEMQNASHAGAIDVTCNVSDPNVTVVELTEQVQQLRCSESTSNLSPPDLPSVSAVEHQSNNESQTANQSSQAPRQPLENHVELSNQDVLQPLDSPICGVIEGLVSLASETRTAPIPSVSNGLPLQTAPAVSSRMPMAMYHDPLQIEIERIMKEKEQSTKIHEDTKLQLKLDCDKEIEEAVAQIRRKYEVKLKEKEAEFLIQTKELDVTYNKVLLNKILAEAFRSKCMDHRASGSAGALQVANSSVLQQLFQHSSQQMVQPSAASGLPSTVSALSMPTVSSATVNSQTTSPSLQPSTASGIPSNGSAISMQTVSPAVVNAQTMGPPLQVVNPSALFSGTLTRPPHISPISSSIGNLQIGTEVRAPAPHLQPFRPSSSISRSSFPLRSCGMSGLQAHNNHPAASLSLRQSYVSPNVYRKALTTAQSGRTQHEIARGLTAPSNSRLTSLDVLMGVNDPSGANANPPGFLLSNSSSRSVARFHGESHLPSSQSNSAQEATDIVCLSDDD